MTPKAGRGLAPLGAGPAKGTPEVDASKPAPRLVDQLLALARAEYELFRGPDGRTYGAHKDQSHRALPLEKVMDDLAHRCQMRELRWPSISVKREVIECLRVLG